MFRFLSRVAPTAAENYFAPKKKTFRGQSVGRKRSWLLSYNCCSSQWPGCSWLNNVLTLPPDPPTWVTYSPFPDFDITVLLRAAQQAKASVLGAQASLPAVLISATCQSY